MNNYIYTFLLFGYLFFSRLHTEELTIIAIINDSNHSVYVDQIDWKYSQFLENNIHDYFLSHIQETSTSSFQLACHKKPLKTKHLYLSTQNIHPVYIKTKNNFFKLFMTKPILNYNESRTITHSHLCFQNIKLNQKSTTSLGTFTLYYSTDMQKHPKKITNHVMIKIDAEENLSAIVVNNSGN